MLTGAELLAKVQELGQAPRDMVATACGYVRPNGKPAFTAFFEALNAAHGITFAKAASKPAAKGKPLSWNVAVAKTGAVPIAAGYANLLGLRPGDRVDITHDATAGCLRLTKAAVAASPAPAPAAACVRELVAA